MPISFIMFFLTYTKETECCQDHSKSLRFLGWFQSEVRLGGGIPYLETCSMILGCFFPEIVKCEEHILGIKAAQI